MKKILCVCSLVLAGDTVVAQGTIVFNNYVPGSIVTHVYAPFSLNPAFRQTGNGTADSHFTTNGAVAGTQDWSGFTLIAANGVGGQYGAANTFAQLLAAPGYDQPEASLQPGIPITTFRTGARAGQVVASTATLNLVPGAAFATVEMVAWDNSSGLYPSWTEASVAWQAGLIAAGKTGTWNQDGFGGQKPAPFMINSDGSQYVQSFNLYFTPEPSTFALAGLGAALLVLFRRKPKNVRIGL